MSKLYYKLLIPLLSVGLVGCDGSDDETPETNLPSQEVTINAQDTVKFATLNTETVVDLRQRVQAQNSEPLLLSDVKQIKGDCDILSVDGLSFNINARDADVCLFEYSVTPASDNYTGNAKAVAQVVANTNPEQGGFLPPFSRTMEKNGEFTFDSSNLITEAGYVLDVDSLVLLNSSGTNDIGEVSKKSESGFTYKAPDSETIVRIYYSAINKTDNIAKPGIIYIAVGQNSNTFPIAQNRLLPPKAFADGTSIIEIDKSWLHDKEGDALQLVYARGNLGTTKIKGDLKFKYKPFSIGSENIAYVVTDHNGGYGVGVLSFDITSYQALYTTWKTIFHPPMTTYDPQLALSSGMNFETGENGLKNYYPIFNHSLATAYCQTKGQRLPTPDELQVMWTLDLGEEPIFTADKNKYRWHSSKNYLTADPNKQVSLKTGEKITSEEPGYFSCIESTAPIEWEFATDFLNMEIGQETQVFQIHKDPATGNVTYRDPDDYELEIKVNKYIMQGVDDAYQPGVTAVETTVHKNTIRFDTPFGPGNQYINATVTDKSVAASIEVNIGIIKCKEDASPEYALRTACIATVGDTKSDRRWTLALPISLLNGPVPTTTPITFFEKGGKAFVGTLKPNTPDWHEYLKTTCDMMNERKVDGRTTWVAGTGAKAHTMSVEDTRWSKAWTDFMAEVAGAGDTSNYGQGYAGRVWDWEMTNQRGTTEYMDVREQGKGGTYTFASCVSD